MLKNLFALVGVAVVTAKAAEWYMDYCELQEENRELKAERNHWKVDSAPSPQS